MTVKDNEVAGRTIEQMIASKIAEETHAEPIFTSGAAFYDFETDTAVYEIKACTIQIKNGYTKSNGEKKQTSRKGRFWINLKSHESIKEYANEQSKELWYIFVLLGTELKSDYSFAVLNELKVDWSTVQALLTDKRKGVCSRANGEKGVNYNLIFKGDCQ